MTVLPFAIHVIPLNSMLRKAKQTKYQPKIPLLHASTVEYEIEPPVQQNGIMIYPDEESCYESSKLDQTHFHAWTC